jgi:hypothetical protein
MAERSVNWRIRTGRTAPWIRLRHCGPCQIASPTWIISGSGGMITLVASSTNTV